MLKTWVPISFERNVLSRFPFYTLLSIFRWLGWAGLGRAGMVAGPCFPCFGCRGGGCWRLQLTGLGDSKVNNDTQLPFISFFRAAGSGTSL